MNSQRFRFLLLVSLVGFCAANVNGMYVIPYGFDSVYQPYGGSTGWTPPVTVAPATTTTTPEPTTTQPPPTTTPSTPVPSTTTVTPPPSSSQRICTKCMKKTSTTVPPTGTPTPKTTPSTTKKPTTTTTTTTTTKKPTTTRKPTTTTTKKPTTTTTSTTTTTTSTTTPRPTPTHPPKKPEDAYSIKYYHQYNYYYPNEPPVTVTKPSKPTKIQASVYIKNVTKAVVPIAENIYMTDSCEVEKVPRPPSTQAPPPPPPVKPHVPPPPPVKPYVPPFRHHAPPPPPPRPIVPSYMSYVPPPSYSPPREYAHASVAADSLEQAYHPYPQPEPEAPSWYNSRRPPIPQDAPINSVQKDIITYLSDPSVLTSAYPEEPEVRGYSDYPPMLPQSHSYNNYNQFLEPGKTWLRCPFSGQQMSNPQPFYG